MKYAFVVCNYEEFKPETYQNIEVIWTDDNDNKISITSSTGNFLTDLDIVLAFCEKYFGMWLLSSSVDDYASDSNTNREDYWVVTRQV